MVERLVRSQQATGLTLVFSKFRKRNTLLLLLLLVAVGGQAQEPVQRFLQPTVRAGIGFGLQNIAFNVEEANLSNSQIVASPNTPLHFLLGGEWNNIGLAVRFKLPLSDRDVEERGKTQFLNFQFQYLRDQLEVDIVYQLHQGMYVDNSRDFSEEFTSIKLPDFAIQTIGLNILYARNPAYSFAAAYRLNARQSRSVASLVWLGGLSGIWLQGPGGPGRGIPAAEGTEASEDVYFIARTASAGVGGAATLQFGSWFISPLAGIALGPQLIDYAAVGDSGQVWKTAPQLFARLGFGFNGDTFFSAFVGSADWRNIQVPEMDSTQGSYSFELIFGYRM